MPWEDGWGAPDGGGGGELEMIRRKEGRPEGCQEGCQEGRRRAPRTPADGAGGEKRGCRRRDVGACFANDSYPPAASGDYLDETAVIGGDLDGDGLDELLIGVADGDDLRILPGGSGP